MIGILILMASAPNIKVTDFGAVPGSPNDATAAVAKAIAAAGKQGTIEFPAGEYHFYRDKAFERDLYLSNSDVVNPRRISILIEKKSNLRLTGPGARLVFHDRVMPIAIIGCNNVSVDGFEIDWQRPLMSQGNVLESGPDGFTLDIDKQKFPYVIEQKKLFFTDSTWKRGPWGMMEFDPRTKGVAYKTGDDGFTSGNWRDAAISEPEPGRVRFDFNASIRGPKVGNVMVIRHGLRDHAGTFILDSKNIKLTGVKYRHTSGLGVLSQYSENLTFKDVEVAPDPKSGRLFAGHDDGFHFSNCRGHISIENCNFQGLMDDPINVHGTSVKITKILTPTKILCRFMHGQSVGMRFGDAGDDVSFIDQQSLLVISKTKIKAIRHLTPEEFEVDLGNPVSKWLSPGDALENLTWTPSLTVKGSTFGRVRARGLLVTTPKKVLIENNLFQSSGSAILISGDANGWYESGAVTDVSIRKNVFEDCNSSSYQFSHAVISILPEIRNVAGPFHRNIKIEENTFKAFDPPILYAYAASHIVFHNNIIEHSQTFPPLRPKQAALTFIGCEYVIVKDNQVAPTFPGRSVNVVGGKPEKMSIDWPQ